MKIIFINRFFFPDNSATSQMLSELAFALAKRGLAVEVITSRLSYDGAQKFKRCENAEGVHVVRVRTTGFGRDQLWGRSLDYLTFYWAAFFCLLRRAGARDVVVAKTDPPMLSVLAEPICRFKGARLVNWLQDLFPEVAAGLSPGEGRLKKLGFGLLRYLRNVSLKRAAFDVAIGEVMAAKLEALGVDEGRIRVIPNWADGKLIGPIEPKDNHLRTEWGLEGEFVVGYSGNLGRAHDIETFLAAIEALEREACNEARALAKIRWLFTGGGAQMAALKREVMRRKLMSVIFKPYQPKERLSESLSLPGVHLISLRPSLEGLIVPSKYYGIAAAGRPAIFVGDSQGEIARTIERSGTGFVVREGDGAGLVNAILALAKDPALANAQGKAARKLFETEFDFPLALAAWKEVIKEASS